MEGIGTVAAIGGFLLAAVLLWAVYSNRKRTPADESRTDAATRKLYAEIDREDEKSDPDKNTF